MGKPELTGFSLIEVLVALFVLALGVIGVAGMQLAALRTAQQSAFQTGALELASEMADAMRANGKQMTLDDSQNPFLKVDYQSASGRAPIAPRMLCYGGTADCGAGDLAQFDIYEWESRVKATLPNGRVRICRDDMPWDRITRSLSWGCDPSAGSVVIKIGWRAKNPDGSFTVDAGQQFPPQLALTVMPDSK